MHPSTLGEQSVLGGSPNLYVLAFAALKGTLLPLFLSSAGVISSMNR